MLDDFMTRATLAGIGVAVAAHPLGSFVVWRRMAYFGDATAHAAILGVALSLALQVSIFAGAVAVALAMALTVSALSGRGYAMDTLLGVLAHSALAFGLVAVSFLSGIRIDLMAYLFGDILAVSRGDLAVIWGGAALVVGLIAWRWSALLTATLNEELAYASGIDPEARTAGPDPVARHHGGRGDQGRGRAADRGHADHPRRRRAAPVADAGEHGADRRRASERPPP
jgi:zinc transport system permease protein